MELNITKQTVCTNDLSFSQNVEQGVDFTVNIPDYCGSVQRILKYSLTPRIFQKKITGQTLSIEGNAFFSIIFLDESGAVSGYESVAPFSKNIELGANYDCLFLNVNAKCGYINAKAITPVRIDVNSVIELSVSLYTKKSTEIISDIDCADVFLNRGETLATMPISASEKNMILDEEIPLTNDFPSIYGILRHNSFVTVSDTKIVNNKVIVKGEFKLHLLYCSDKRKPCCFDCAIPFSQIIDVDGVNENCKCETNVEVLSVDIKPRSNFDGDVRSFLLCAKLCISVNAYCDNNIAVVYDAYSSKFNTTSENSNTFVEKLSGNINEVFGCKKTLDFSDGELGSIIDIWSLCATKGYRIEGNSLIISGTVTICGLCENEEGTVNYFERPIDFEYTSSAGTMPENLRIDPSVEVLNLSHTLISANSIEISVELALEANIYAKNRLNVLTDFKALDDNLKKPSDCSMIIYYAERGEHTWNIAKRFGASPEDIMSVNSVSSVIPENMPIIISC